MGIPTMSMFADRLACLEARDQYWQKENVGLREERDALSAQNERMREALEDMLAQASGTKKHCGHDFECVCPGDKTRAALSLPARDCLKERDARKAAEVLREAAERWNKEADRFSTAYGFLNTLAAAKERGE